MRWFLVHIAAAVTSCTLLAAAPVPGLELTFDRLNGTYEDLVATVEPIRSGAVTIQLSSPEHQLELVHNRLELESLGGLRHDVRVEARFSGFGWLVADLDFSGLPASLRDRVVFPDQRASVEGRVRIEQVEEGYLVTVEELPRFVAIEMHSELGGELISWCQRLALLVAGDAGCAELDQRLSHPQLPLPEPGTVHLVRGDELTAEERARIDRYLGGID